MYNYMRQGLLVKLQGAGEVARWMLANADGTQLTEFGICVLLSRPARNAAVGSRRRPPPPST